MYTYMGKALSEPTIYPLFPRLAGQYNHGQSLFLIMKF